MEDDFREMTGRELLLSLSRLGYSLQESARHLRADVFDRDEDEEPSDLEEDSDHMEEDGDDDAATLQCVMTQPASCSFLFPGRTFSGQQRLTGPHRQQEDWVVTATIYSCDFAQGRLTGSMVAQNSPQAKRPIVTYFEGDIIDNKNNTFWTGCKWGACPSLETDVRYWGRCPGFSSAMRAAVVRHDGRAPQLAGSQYLFMRWKECFFVDVPQDCPLTITGFYYLSLDRTTGAIGGYYHDTRSAPLQILQLRPVEMCALEANSSNSGSGNPAGSAGSCGPGVPPPEEVPAGMAFGSYSLC